MYREFHNAAEGDYLIAAPLPYASLARGAGWRQTRTVCGILPGCARSVSQICWGADARTKGVFIYRKSQGGGSIASPLSVTLYEQC